MKHLLVAGAILGMSNMAMAADSQQLRHRFTDYANVVDVQPVYKRIRHQTPKQECWVEQVEHVVTREGSSRRFGETSSRNNGGGGEAVIGGIIGGVIGNQLGRNAGRGARNGATVAGAIIGSVIANESRSNSGNVTRHRNNQRSNKRSHQRSHQRSTKRSSARSQPKRVVTTRPVERCRETTHTTYEEQLQAYDVTYRYQGQRFTTRMNRDPGDRIELQINVAPARR